MKEIEVFTVSKSSIRFVASAFVLLLSGMAHAGSIGIDFRDGGEWGGDGLPEYPDCGTAEICIDANGGNLYWDEIDGYGVQGGEWDEIDTDEVLTVWFDEGLYAGGNLFLTGVLLTDLFPTPDGGSRGESAVIELFDENGLLLLALNGSRAIYANDYTTYHPNGEIYIDFGGEFTPASVRFTTIHGHDDSEYSVAGFSTVAVPEPGTLFLLGSVLLALTWQRRRRMSRDAVSRR